VAQEGMEVQEEAASEETVVDLTQISQIHMQIIKYGNFFLHP